MVFWISGRRFWLAITHYYTLLITQFMSQVVTCFDLLIFQLVLLENHKISFKTFHFYLSCSELLLLLIIL